MRNLISGWIPQKVDVRDYKYSVQRIKISLKYDIVNKMPNIYDQGQIGSCVGNGVTALIEYILKNESKDFLPSRLFAYYNARIDKLNDTGAEIRDGIKGVCDFGLCHEQKYPYIITKFTEKPSDDAYNDAILYKAIKYESLKQTEISLKTALFNNNPIVFGMMLKKSFESKETANTGIYKPKGSIIGGHCMVIVGYNDETKLFTVRNSWGDSWGDKGLCYIPYKEILNKKIASDFWIITKIAS
jgi:C1A family cysteine protease